MAKLRYFFRHWQPKDENGDNIVYYGPNPQNLSIKKGNVPVSDYIEFSNEIENGDKITFSWRLREDEGVNVGASNIDRGVSGEVIAVNNAYRFVMDWLNDSVSAPLNMVQVKVLDDECGFFDEWVIKSEAIRYCDKDTCRLNVTLRQTDPAFECIQKTLITDNWQHWFDNTGVKKHPRYQYCNEARPNWLLTINMLTLCSVGALLITIYVGIYPVIIGVALIVNSIVFLINAFSRLFGGNKLKYIDVDSIDNPSDVQDWVIDFAVQCAGCGRELPAVLIRDYITNVCNKCNVRVDQTTVPVFFNPSSPYFNLTQIDAEVKRGFEEDDGSNYYRPENDPLLTLDMLLDNLKQVFNAEWRVRNNTLYFDRKDKFLSNEIIYNFEGPDKEALLDGVCFMWNDVKKPAYWRAGYGSDATDMIATDAKRRYNDLVECNIPNNPMLEGEGQKLSTVYAATRFRGDGIYKDYIGQAMKAMGILQWLTIITIPVFQALKSRLKRYQNALLTSNWHFFMPKLVIWDGVNFRAARAKWQYQYNGVMPPANPKYNTTGASYHSFHPDDETVDDFHDVNTRLINYDMFFEANFLGNMWDRFHQIDDPRINPGKNKTFELRLPLCCEHVTRLGLTNAAIDIALSKHIQLNGGQYYKDGKIKEIEISYDSSDSLGRWIRLKGDI